MILKRTTWAWCLRRLTRTAAKTATNARTPIAATMPMTAVPDEETDGEIISAVTQPIYIMPLNTTVTLAMGAEGSATVASR